MPFADPAEWGPAPSAERPLAGSWDYHYTKGAKCFGGNLGNMKRISIFAAAALAGSVPFQPEAEDPACRTASCAVAQSVKVPEQPHSHEEPLAYEPLDDMVAITFSPVTRVKRGSESHLQWLSDNGFDASQVSANPFDLFMNASKLPVLI